MGHTRNELQELVTEPSISLWKAASVRLPHRHSRRRSAQRRPNEGLCRGNATGWTKTQAPGCSPRVCSLLAACPQASPQSLWASPTASKTIVWRHHLKRHLVLRPMLIWRRKEGTSGLDAADWLESTAQRDLPTKKVKKVRGSGRQCLTGEKLAVLSTCRL